MLKYSEKAQTRAFEDRLYIIFLTENSKYMMVIEGEENTVSSYVEDMILRERNKIVCQALDDKDIELLFNPEEIGAFNATMTNFLSCLYIDYSFIPKNEMNEGIYLNQNILFIETLKRDESKVKAKFNEALDLLWNADCLFSKQTPVDSNDKGYESLKKYIQIGKSIRKIDLIPVLMGTNACLANIVNFQGTFGSRGDCKSIWCYIIVYKLAPPSQEFIQNEKLSLIESINSSVADGDSKKNKVIAFVTAVTAKMKYERLFFCNLIFENLNLHIPNTVRFDAVRFLDDASANAFSRKKNLGVPIKIF